MRCSQVRCRLAAFRELSAVERDEVQRHLAGCPTCAAFWEACRAQDQALASLPELRPSARLTAAVLHRTTRLVAPRRSLGPRLASAAVALLLMISVTVGGTLRAAADALPGEILYPVKRAAERARLTLTLDIAAREEYREALAGKRREEVREVVRLERSAQVEFEGRLESVTDGEWIVEGLPVSVPADIWGREAPPVGALVAIKAKASAGVVAASRVQVKPATPDRGKPGVTREPSPTPRPSPTPTRLPATPTRGSKPTRTPLPRTDARVEKTPPALATVSLTGIPSDRRTGTVAPVTPQERPSVTHMPDNEAQEPTQLLPTKPASLGPSVTATPRFWTPTSRPPATVTRRPLVPPTKEAWFPTRVPSAVPPPRTPPPTRTPPPAEIAESPGPTRWATAVPTEGPAPTRRPSLPPTNEEAPPPRTPTERPPLVATSLAPLPTGDASLPTRTPTSQLPATTDSALVAPNDQALTSRVSS